MGTRVYLLDNGTMARDMSFITWNQGHGIEVRFPVYAIYVDHPDAKIVIDTGFDRAWVERMLPFTKPEQSDDQSIVNQLAKIGVRPEEIDIVVNTHLHFDHCSGNKYFPGAKFIMSKSELRHAFVPDHWERMMYDRNLVDMPGARLELIELHDGYEYEVVSGVSLLHTPGHSNGHLSVIIYPTNLAPMVFPVDVAFTRRNLTDKVLMGQLTDPEDLLRSMIKIQNVASKLGGTLFYPHDAEEFKSYKKAPEFYGE